MENLQTEIVLSEGENAVLRYLLLKVERDVKLIDGEYWANRFNFVLSPSEYGEVLGILKKLKGQI